MRDCADANRKSASGGGTISEYEVALDFVMLRDVASPRGMAQLYLDLDLTLTSVWRDFVLNI
jgi:hypothetical protein